MGPKDAFGRPLHVGDHVMVTSGECPLYTLVDLQPMLDPRAPRGALVATFQATVQIPCGNGAVLKNLARVRTVAELQLGETHDGPPEGGDGPPEKATKIKLV